MTRDQFIAEMMGKPDIIEAFDGSSTRKYRMSYNYSTSPFDILALQQFVMGAEWWGEFYWFVYEKDDWHIGKKDDFETPHCIKWLFSDPDRFATLVAEYRGWKNERIS